MTEVYKEYIVKEYILKTRTKSSIFMPCNKIEFFLSPVLFDGALDSIYKKKRNDKDFIDSALTNTKENLFICEKVKGLLYLENKNMRVKIDSLREGVEKVEKLINKKIKFVIK